MATRAQEAEILQGGTDAGSTTPGAFVLNMLDDEGSWKVRQGFGQVAQFDTSMSQNIPGATTDWGYQKHLGSHYMKTNFGHEQIITLLASKNITSSGERYQEIHYLYSVNIYDVTTGERWEEMVFRQTCENANPTTNDNTSNAFSIPKWHGVYETSWDKSYQAWASAQSGAKKVGFHKEAVLIGGQTPPFFVEFGDILYFGTKETGLLAYIPSVFKGNRNKSVNDVYRHEWNGPYSESAVIRRVPMVPGIEKGNFDYYNQGNFPTPSCATKFVNRLVYGSGKFIFFSDPGFVSSTVIENTVEIPCDGDITAVSEVGGSVIIFTQSETWAYRPSTTFIATAGVLERISSNVGCLSPAATTKVEGGLYWADVNGCYTMSNALQTQEISTPIAEFFSSSLSNPVTSYYARNGLTTLDTQQPRTSLRMDTDGVSLSYAPSLGVLFVNVPGQNTTLCMTGSGWSVWSYTSVVYTGGGAADMVGIRGGGDTDNPEGPINRPWIVTSPNDVWLVGNLDKQTMNDVTAIDNDTLSSSYCIMRYGKGGGIDRSVDSWDADSLNKKGREDNRGLAGNYKRFPVREFAAPYAAQSFNPDASVFLEKPIEVSQSFVFEHGNYSGATAGAGKGPAIPSSPNIRIVLVPVWAAIKWSVLGGAAGGGCSGIALANVTTGAIEKLEIMFEFDNSVWAPVFSLTGNQSDANVDPVFPSERIEAAGSISAKCYSDSALTTLSVTGQYMKLVLDASSLSGSFSEFNLSDGKRDCLVYLPFYTTSTSALGGIVVGDPAAAPVRCSVSDVGATNTAYPSFYVWDQMIATGSMRTEDSVAVPVDWAYKGNPVKIDKGTRIKTRGLVSTVQSRGPGVMADLLNPNWDFGLFNTLASADLKGWTSQVIDYTGAGDSTITEPESIVEIRNKTGIRTRVMPSGGTLTTRTFSSTGASGTAVPTWANTSAAGNQGNFLIDDEEVSEIVTSDSVKGDQVAYMLFGHIQNRAQAFGLGSVRVLFRALGFLRRTGK
jgi:hypothetical protein